MLAESQAKVTFSVGKLLSLSYILQHTYKSYERHHLNKNFGSKYYYKDPNLNPKPNPKLNKKKKMCGSESEKNEFGSTTLPWTWRRTTTSSGSHWTHYQASQATYTYFKTMAVFPELLRETFGSCSRTSLTK
jgi:hypothetical protein